MRQNSLYVAIEDRLSKDLDPEMFERCAVDLLKADYPGLVPIRGGSDDGRDGEVFVASGPALPLICTTRKQVLQNLKGSLKSYVTNGHTARRVILATSRTLSSRKRNNLRSEAEKNGFELAQIHDAADFVTRLFHHPAWCKELLGITGRPSALTQTPESSRVQLGVPLIGREKLIERIKSDSTDVVLVGQPGSGKTAVLNALIDARRAYFLIDSDREALANAIRELTPEIIIIDDAHMNPTHVRLLRQLRRDTEASFRIIAATWPSCFQTSVTAEFGPDLGATIDLSLLSREQIVEVIQATRIRFSEAWVQEILDQSVGLPGIAVTLCDLCVNQRARLVADGSAILQEMDKVCQRLFLQQADEARRHLAIFALGGRAGLDVERVAVADNCSISLITSRFSQLATGGVISVRTVGQRTYYMVQPEAFRDALVKEVFFGPTPTPIDRYAILSSFQDEVICSLLGAARRGAVIDRRWLFTRVRSCQLADAWKRFAGLGEAEARLILQECPHEFITVHEQCLWHCPDAIVPLLLPHALYANDERPQPDIRQSLVQWVSRAEPGDLAAVERRRLLISELLKLPMACEHPDLAVRLVTTCLYPKYEENYVAPGSGRRWVRRNGMLLLAQVREIFGLWNEIYRWLQSLDHLPWKELLALVQSWGFPFIQYSSDDPDLIRKAMKQSAQKMLRDLAALPIHNPAAVEAILCMADLLEIVLELERNSEFFTVFPNRSYERVTAKGEFDRDTFDREVVAAARQLGTQWARLPSREVAEKILRFIAFQHELDTRGTDLTCVICDHICQSGCDVIAWAEVFDELNCPTELVRIFAFHAVRMRAPGIDQFLKSRMVSSRHRPWIVGLTLADASVSDDIVDELYPVLNSGDFASIKHCGWPNRGQLSSRLIRLLHHRDQGVRMAAALAIDYETEHAIPNEILHDWKSAIIDLPKFRDERWLIKDVVTRFPDLAFPFVSHNLETDCYEVISPDLSDAVERLTKDERVDLVRHLTTNSSPGLVRALIGDDLDCFRELIRSDLPIHIRLAPLKQDIDHDWIRYATVAAEEGCSATELEGGVEYGISYCGSLADAWVQRVASVESAMTEARHSVVTDVLRKVLERFRSRLAHASDYDAEEWGDWS